MFIKKVDYSINKEKYNSFSQEIERLVPAKTHVLDVGCATGKLARILKEKGCTVVGVDIDQASLEVASEFCQRVLVVDIDDLKDIDRVLKGEKFDVITFGDILEHIKYPGVLLHHLRSYLKPRGVIVASIPNAAFIWCRVRFMLGNFNYVKTGGLMDEDHLRFFSFSTIRTLFIESGFNIRELYGSSNVRPIYGFLRPLAKIFPNLFAIHAIVKATKGR